MSLALTSSDQHQFTALLVALTHAEGVGAKTMRTIVRYCQQHQIRPEAWWTNLSQFQKETGLSKKVVESVKKLKKEHNFYDWLEMVKVQGLQPLAFFDQHYPSLLKTTDDYPAVLFIESQIPVTHLNWQTLLAQSISVVGTRKMTAYGRLVLDQLLPPLFSVGYCVVSGFMYGVDLEAARLAVAHHRPTVAVLGYGHNHCFPKHQQRDREQFLAAGAVFVSEYPPNFPPLASNFVRRNRIVAGLTRATLVVEAAVKSGSHITAAFANDYGRLVMTVPGPITNPYSMGTKTLVDQGAVLVTSADDILTALADDYGLQRFVTQTVPVPGTGQEQSSATNSSLQAICEHLQASGGMTFTELCHYCQIDERSLNQFLFDLELQGRISKQHGTYCLKL